MTAGPRAAQPLLPPRPPLLVIAGATATGKTGLAIEVALGLRDQGVRAEVISADSRQVYRGLDIATAKATLEERRGVPHHGLDLVDPDAPFSVADFVRATRVPLAAIAERGDVAILAGGTGLYLRAVARGLDVDALPTNRDGRARIDLELLENGLEAAARRLEELAPRLASRIDRHNPRRVARALEIAELRGDAPPPAPLGYAAPVAWLGLELDAATHRAWIEARARAQFSAGLIDEARALRERFDPALPAFSAIGYREAWAVIDGEVDLETAIQRDADRNVAFSRRQRTWFRSEPEVRWLDAGTAPLLPEAIAAARRLLALGAAR